MNSVVAIIVQVSFDIDKIEYFPYSICGCAWDTSQQTSKVYLLNESVCSSKSLENALEEKCQSIGSRSVWIKKVLG